MRHLADRGMTGFARVLIRIFFRRIEVAGVDNTILSSDLGLVGSCCCYDPNGNLIELIELKPGVRHSRANEALLADVGDRNGKMAGG